MAHEAEAVERGDDSLGFLKSMTTLGRSRPVATPSAPANDVTGAARHDPGPSVVSIDVEMKGTIRSPAELHIHGAVEGDIRAATLKVCPGGSVKGDIVAEVIVIAGLVEGRIFGRDVKLAAGANVIGDIAHGSLGIDPAAEFEGSVKRYEDPIQQAAR